VNESIRELEAVAVLGWQAVEQSRLGGWLLRASEGFTGRANSALPLGEPGRPLPDAVDAVQAWYVERGLPAAIVVPHPLTGRGGDPLDELLSRRGWRIRPAPAVVMTATTADLIGLGPPAPVEVSPEPSTDWLSLYHYRGQALPPVGRRLLLSAPWQAFATARVDSAPAAIGRVAVGAGWAGLTAIEVAPGYRRRGLATAVTAALAQAAVERGARRTYLQVEETNEAARRLYAGCGFVERHRYHYRIAP
jgi:N-acetylglutamate synthase